jgi:gas vesicle protein
MGILSSLKAILIGSVIGGISSVLLSLTLEPEISEVRMGQYGLFIGLIASSVTSVILTPSTRKDDQSKPELTPNKPDSKPEFNPILTEIVIKATNNHLNALLPGSPEYFEALELYGKLLLGNSGTPNTNTPKNKTSHHAQGA